LGDNAIQVTILNDPLRQDCDASCGTDWSSLQALDQARKQINERFDREIQLTYLDLTKDTTSSDVLKWNDEIESKNLSLPLLILNGQLRISGRFDIRQLLDIIEVQIETGV
jgi:disulfide oxidoreductase YuzD